MRSTIARSFAASAAVVSFALTLAGAADPALAQPKGKHRLLKIFEVGPKQLSMSPDGKEVWATELYMARVVIIDAVNLTIKKVIKMVKPEEPVEVLHRARAKEVWISILNRKRVHVYHSETKELLYKIEVGPEPKGIAFSPDEKLAWVTNWKGKSVSIIDVEKRKVVKTVRVGRVPRGVAVTPDGKEAWVAGFVGRDIHIIDTETFEVKHVIRRLLRDPRHLVFSPDGKTAYLASNRSGTVQVIDVATRKVTKNVKTGSGGRSIILAHGGRYAYVANYYTREVVVVDTEKLEVVERIPALKQCIAVVISPDQKRIFVSNYNMWKVMAFEVPGWYRGEKDEPRVANADPDDVEVVKALPNPKEDAVDE